MSEHFIKWSISDSKLKRTPSESKNIVQNQIDTERTEREFLFPCSRQCSRTFPESHKVTINDTSSNIGHVWVTRCSNYNQKQWMRKGREQQHFWKGDQKAPVYTRRSCFISDLEIKIQTENFQIQVLTPNWANLTKKQWWGHPAKHWNHPIRSLTFNNWGATEQTTNLK